MTTEIIDNMNTELETLENKIVTLDGLYKSEIADLKTTQKAINLMLPQSILSEAEIVDEYYFPETDKFKPPENNTIIVSVCALIDHKNTILRCAEDHKEESVKLKSETKKIKRAIKALE